jgi:hypothetical protein
MSIFGPNTRLVRLYTDYKISQAKFMNSARSSSAAGPSLEEQQSFVEIAKTRLNLKTLITLAYHQYSRFMGHWPKTEMEKKYALFVYLEENLNEDELDEVTSEAISVLSHL